MAVCAVVTYGSIFCRSNDSVVGPWLWMSDLIDRDVTSEYL